MLRLRHDTPAGVIEARFYGAERPGFGVNSPETYTEILGSLESVSALRYLEQVHGDKIHEVSLGSPGTELVGEGDAIITHDPGIALVIRTADCIPILIFSRQTGLIAAVHAGWRGLAAGIVAKTISKLCDEQGAKRDTLQVIVGPCIAANSYEVGQEVASQFSVAARCQRPNGKFSLDLLCVLKEQLNNLLISESQIELHVADTFTSSEWYSARRGDTLRNFAVIARHAPPANQP